ncbi:uncharacterized protein LOC125594181 [Brassica napus]|uniref:uncharacterized protein LOC125594181 n=1 Tax=Brassica napus TaxID=3708 RepID=UPI002078AEE4|nr:uncharacterized protein LOC125594181 [Brassica napus]
MLFSNPQSNSWLVNKLLKLKHGVPFNQVEVAEWRKARFWSDNWTPFGDLHTHLSGTNSRLGIPLHATVASLYRNGTWSLPPARSEAQIELYVYLTTVELNSSQDYYEWEINGQVQTTYRTGRLYDYLCALKPDVVCYDLWAMVARRLQLVPYRHWPITIQQLIALPPPASQRILTRLAWQATLYWLWTERNTRLHTQMFRSVDQIFKLLDRQLKNKLQSFRDTNRLGLRS